MNATLERRWLYGILLAALALRLVALIALDGRVASTDEAHWQRMGQLLWEEGIMSVEAGLYRPPLYPLLVASLYGAFGPQALAIRLCQVLLSTLTCFFLWSIARRACGQRAALYAAAIAAAYPFFIFFSTVLMAETLLLFLLVVSLCLVQRLVAKPSRRHAVELGLVLGLAALCKPVILAWVPLLGAAWWGATSLALSIKVKRLATILLAVVCMVVPWSVRNLYLSGHVVPISTNMGINLLVGHEPGATGLYRDGVDYWSMMEDWSDDEADAVVRDALVAHRMVAHILENPRRTLELSLRKIALLWNPLPAGESLLRQGIALATTTPLLLLGLLGSWRLRREPVGWSALTLALALTLVHALFFAHTRFRLPIDAALIAPAACLLASAGKENKTA